MRTYEIRREGQTEVSDLYYDDSGNNLRGFAGQLPPDRSWPWGWGKEVAAIKCAVGLYTSKGTLDQIRFAITVVNRGGSFDHVRGYYPKLLDAQGEVVPWSNQTDPAKKRGGDGGCLLRTGAAWMPAHLERLAYWYPELPPGRYTLTVFTRGRRGDQFSLKSAPVSFEIEAGETE